VGAAVTRTDVHEQKPPLTAIAPEAGDPIVRRAKAVKLRLTQEYERRGMNQNGAR